MTNTTKIVLAIAVIATLVMGVFAALKVHDYLLSYEMALATARAHESQLVQDKVKLDAVVKDETAKREAIEKEQKVVTKTIVVREQQAQKDVAEVTAPANANVKKQAGFVVKFYGITQTPVAPSANTLSFTVPQVTKFITTKIERDQYEKDKVDLKKVLFLEQQKTKSLSYELGETKGQLNKTESMYREYKDVAVKTRNRKILDGIIVGLEIGGAGLAGYGIHAATH